jgi:type I restriction enzyme M protein
MAQLENIEAIEKRLWSAADNLRANSNYASNEYFMPVMGLIFLRHAYSRYLGVKDGNRDQSAQARRQDPAVD